MPIKIYGSNKQSIHDAFYNALTKNSNSLALSQLWVCGINRDTLVSLGKIMSDILNKYEIQTWNVNLDGTTQSDVNDIVLHEANWDGVEPGTASNVYLWAQGISFIGDGINTSRVGSSQTGALKGLISDGRMDLNAANITFLESNVSFVDGFLRPWSVLVGHRSLKDQNLRCDIELFALEKWELTEPFKVRKSMLFKNAVPVSIDAEEYNYTGDKLIERQVQFAFDRYESRVYPLVTAVVDPLPPIVEGRKAIDAVLPGQSLSLTGLLNAAQQTLGTVSNAISRTRGAADAVANSVAQGLIAVGQEGLANRVTGANQQFAANIAPIANVIGTGQGAIGGAQNLNYTVGNITGSGSVDAAQVAATLKGP